MCSACVSRQSRVCELEWVADGERGGASRASRGEEARKPPREADLLARPHEDFLVFFLERKVHGLRWEVPHAVGQVAAPQRENTLLPGHADQGVHHARVLRRARIAGRDLQQNLGALERRANSLGDDTAGTTQRQVPHE